MITSIASHAHFVSLATQSSTSSSSSSISSPSTGSSTPSTCSSTPSSTRASEIARAAISTTSSTPTSSSPTLIGESDALKRWRTHLDPKLQLLTQAKQYFSQNDVLKTLQIVNLILQKAPDFLPALEMRLNIHRIEALKTQLSIAFNLRNYKEVRITAESILEIHPNNRIAIKYLQKIRKNQIKAFQKHLKDLFESECYGEARRITHILLEVNPHDRYAQKYLSAIQQCATLPAVKDQSTVI